MNQSEKHERLTHTTHGETVRRERAPNGVDARRISMPLTVAERDELSAISASQMRTMAHMARLIFLRGLEATRAENTGEPK